MALLWGIPTTQTHTHLTGDALWWSMQSHDFREYQYRRPPPPGPRLAAFRPSRLPAGSAKWISWPALSGLVHDSNETVQRHHLSSLASRRPACLAVCVCVCWAARVHLGRRSGRVIKSVSGPEADWCSLCLLLLVVFSCRFSLCSLCVHKTTLNSLCFNVDHLDLYVPLHIQMIRHRLYFNAERS